MGEVASTSDPAVIECFPALTLFSLFNTLIQSVQLYIEHTECYTPVLQSIVTNSVK